MKKNFNIYYKGGRDTAVSLVGAKLIRKDLRKLGYRNILIVNRNTGYKVK